MAKKCECGHASVFHQEMKKAGGLVGFADGISGAFGGSKEAQAKVCNVKGCACLRWVEDE